MTVEILVHYCITSGYCSSDCNDHPNDCRRLYNTFTGSKGGTLGPPASPRTPRRCGTWTNATLTALPRNVSGVGIPFLYDAACHWQAQTGGMAHCMIVELLCPPASTWCTRIKMMSVGMVLVSHTMRLEQMPA